VKTKLWREIAEERLRENSTEAQAYLEVAFEEFVEGGDTGALLLTLRTVAKAQSGDQAKTSINDNPTLSELITALRELGYRLSIKAMH